MIHDLDIILAMDRTEVVGVEAIGVPVLTPKIDIANARVKMASGCIANLTASRISRDKVRKVRCFQPDMYVSVDYGAQELEVWRLRPRAGERPEIEGGRGRRHARRAAAARARGLRGRDPAAAGRRSSPARTAAARWRWRRESPRRWQANS